MVDLLAMDTPKKKHPRHSLYAQIVGVNIEKTTRARRPSKRAQRRNMLDANRPIRVFYANLLRMGIKLRAVDGELKISGRKDLATPVVREEIIKRAEFLIELLSPEVPEALQPYFYRLIKVDEVKEAVGIAEQMGISLRQTPVNGGWLLEIMNHRVSKMEKKR